MKTHYTNLLPHVYVFLIINMIRSAASSEMRQLEYERQQLDLEVVDIEHALAIREGTTRSSDSLLGRRYADAARAVADVNAILTGKHSSSSSGGG